MNGHLLITVDYLASCHYSSDYRLSETLHDMSSFELAFRKQFLVSRSFSNTVNECWTSEPLWRGYRLLRCPGLHYARYSKGKKDLVLLGVCCDPLRPALTEADIAAGLVTESSNFQEFEAAIKALSGRWVMFANFDGEARVYHDACGLKPVFYVDGVEGELAVASQPALLEFCGFTTRQQDLFLRFRAECPGSSSWPVNMVPYLNVRQLLPNHTLVLNSGSIRRYWPTHPIPGNSIDWATERIIQLLTGALTSFVERGQCHVGLSGGFDSRLICAAAPEPLRKELHFYTVRGAGTKRHDLTIPAAIARSRKLRYDVYDAIQASSEVATQLIRNTGEMFQDPVISMVPTFGKVIGNGFCIEGMMSETLRCYYWREPSGEQADLEPVELARLAGFGDSAIARCGFETWRAGVPTELGVSVLDLLYWEHRGGVWASCGWTMKEGLYESLAPMNNRALLEAGLTIPQELRNRPYQLFTNLIERLDPSLLKWPFNTTRVEQICRRYPVPWRLRKWLRAT